MNYAGNEALRAELAALLGESYQMHMRLGELSRRYFWDSEALIERLAGQILHDAYERHIEIFKRLSVLKTILKIERKDIFHERDDHCRLCPPFATLRP